MKEYLHRMILALVSYRVCQCYRIVQSKERYLNIPTPTPVPLEPVYACLTYPEMTSIQFRWCKRYPDVTATAIQGIQRAVFECQYQFRNERWNCSNLVMKNRNPHSSPFLSKGFKESAFAHAVTSAGIVHQVARECSTGRLATCSCDSRLNFRHKDKQFKWRGCHHNIIYGMHFSKRFLNSKESGRDILSVVNLHNNKAGRLTVSRHLKKTCKCHGLSGGCEMKTCWLATPSLRELGDMLKETYRQAIKVANTNEASGKFEPVKSGPTVSNIIRQKPKHFNAKLVYFEHSPSFCDWEPQLDHPGTQGRRCNRTSIGTDGCKSLCCGRGYNTLRQTDVRRCQCKFHWCCHVTCKLCKDKELRTVCK